jgi:hypothetical protein
MKSLVGDPLLTDTFPPRSLHNSRARVLRSGLVVSAFSQLESYIEERLEEKIVDLPASRITYTSFGTKLRSLLSQDALQGLVTRMGFLESSQRLAFAESKLPVLSAFLQSPPIYTGYGFSPKGSNVGDADISGLISAFGVSGGWNRLSQLCSQIGASRLSLYDDFRGLLRARNNAAHDSSTNIPSGDLSTHLATALLVGLVVDLTITHSIDCYIAEPTTAQAEQACNLLALHYRFIDETPTGAWNERSGTAGRVIKCYPDLASAKSGAKSRRKPAHIIVRDVRQIPIELA